MAAGTAPQWQENIQDSATDLDAINTTIGAKADTAITDSTTTNTTQSFIKGFVKILADVWDSVNHLLHFNLKQVGGNAVAPGNNAVPVLNSAATGYVAAYGSNAAALTANTDYLFKWGAGGTTQVNHIMIQNNSSILINWDLDVATSAGSPVLSNTAGVNTLFLDVQTSILHIQGNGTPNVNGTSASDIVVRGWL